MIHTKLLIRRLAYVPWLLAFGLVLGWAGARKGVLADVPCSAITTSTPLEFDRYLIALPTLIFPADTAKDATVEGMITFTPMDDDIIGND